MQIYNQQTINVIYYVLSNAQVSNNITREFLADVVFHEFRGGNTILFFKTLAEV